MKFALGFMFSEDSRQVALIMKDRPEWQKGKLNAPGGKIEPGETPLAAMVREFKEETGYQTEPSNWSLFARMEGNVEGSTEPFEVHCFVAVGQVRDIRQTEDEVPRIIETGHISLRRSEMVENLPWLLYMALDHLTDGRPDFALITYP